MPFQSSPLFQYTNIWISAPSLLTSLSSKVSTRCWRCIYLLTEVWGHGWKLVLIDINQQSIWNQQYEISAVSRDTNFFLWTNFSYWIHKLIRFKIYILPSKQHNIYISYILPQSLIFYSRGNLIIITIYLKTILLCL